MVVPPSPSLEKLSDHAIDQLEIGKIIDAPQFTEEQIQVVNQEAQDTTVISEDRTTAVLDVIAEVARRRMEALNLYEPLLLQGQFHLSKAPERVLRGSNRSGKTLSAAVEVARALVGCDPYDKYPKQDGRCIVVAKSGKSLGEVIYRKLFKPGAFRIIRDDQSGLWRAWRPWLEEDANLKHLTRPAPALIPKRMVATVSWENKAQGIPNLVKLTNGWEIAFYSSLGEPPQGVDIDLAWFDEEIVVETWYSEISARLVDRSGKFLWSATPQSGTEQLFALHEKAAELKAKGVQNPRCEEFLILLKDNPHLDEEQKDILSSKLSDEERKVRIDGEFLIVTYKVFPEFSPKTHCVRPFAIPSNWCRYMSVDPGRAVCAVLFCAVPPPGDDYEGQVFFYDELYLRDCTSWKFGESLAPKVNGANFELFLIDQHGGRIKEIGSGRSVESQYVEQLRSRKLQCNRLGSAFYHGCDDVMARIEACRDWLGPHHNGKPKIQVFDNLTNFLHEIKYYHNKRKNGELTDNPEQRKNHQMDNMGYLVMLGVPYRQPKKMARKSPLLEALRKKQERERKKNGKPYINLGPGK